MSVEELYPDRGAAGRRPDDSYATRPLTAHAISDRTTDMSLLSAPPARSRSTRRPPGRGASIAVYIILSVVVIALLGAGGGLYYLDRSYQGKIYPNVTVQGLNVGELTPQEAEAALRARYGTFLQQPATLTYGQTTWQPSIADLGIDFGFKNAIASAYMAGRGNGLIEDLRDVYAIWQNGLDLPVSVTFDQNKMRAYVASVSADLEQAPLDAKLLLSGTTVTTSPARTGRQVLVDQTVQELSAALSSFRPSTIALKTRELPPRLSDAAVADARQRILAMLQGPLTLKLDTKEYVWQPEEIALMLDIARVSKDSSSDTIAVELNRYQVDRRMRKIADETGRGSVNPRVDWNNGDLRIIKPGKPGLRMDEAQASALIRAAIGGTDRVLALPVHEVEPQVTPANLRSLGIDELVSLGQSDFTGSADYRIHNIGVGMNTLNGLLLAPGEEFSFNDNIGSIDESNGYVEGYAIIQNRTQLEFGGGICQDSTTLYRAAFWAGLPITERWGHSFYISWYDKYGLGDEGNGSGMDATIFTGGPDFKFVNDTGHWLLLQSSSNPRTGVAQVAFYGTKPNRTVTLTRKVYDRVPAPAAPTLVVDPKQPAGSSRQSDHARGGMTIDIYRTITENGIQKKPELFRTKFRAWPNIYVFNPADIGPDGKPLIGYGAQPPAQPTPAPEQPTPPAEQPTPDPVNAGATNG